jgi:hypothetical protein
MGGEQRAIAAFGTVPAVLSVRGRIARTLAKAVMLLAALSPAAGLAAGPLPVDAPRDSAWEQLRKQDLRLAKLVFRLAQGNASLCAITMPGTGIVLHALDQYPPDQRAQARDVLGFPVPLAVEAVVPGSAAERAGLHAGDGVLAINDWAAPATAPAPRADSGRRDAALARIEAAPPAAPLALRVQRGDQALTFTLAPRPVCRVRPELVVDGGSLARTDDLLLQISAALLDRFDDDGLVVVVAHELAHLILRHGDRLLAAGVHRGLLGEFGRSAQLARAAEDEADRYSARLLANAGYDPQLAVRFWRGAGRSLDAGLLRDSAHSSPSRRARNIAEEIDRLAAGGMVPAIP